MHKTVPTVDALISQQARLDPEALALLAPECPPVTFGSLLRRIRGLARLLADRGVDRTGRTAIVLPNGPDMAVAFLASSLAGVSAPLNPGFSRREFDFYLRDLKARVLLVGKSMDSPARAVASGLGIPVIEFGGGHEPAAVEAEDSHTARNDGPRPGDVALVLHTSGTTARPKMVPLTHANLCASAAHIQTTLALGPSDRCLNVMPLFHIHGLVAALLSSLGAGGSVVCTPGFYAPQFLDWLREFRPTWYTAVPTMHHAIVSRLECDPEAARAYPLRFVRSSSSALAPSLLERLESVFSAPVIEAYGMTEAAHQMASNPLPPGRRKPGSVGRAAGPEIGVMDEEGSHCAQGITGEVVIRGPNVTPGYEGNPEANSKSFTGGWFRTGDQGYLDDEGYLYLTGRLKELINRGGEKIAPREIDEVILEHPAVAQAVAFALPHPSLGEDVAAAVVLREGREAAPAEIQAYAAARLSGHKVPRRVVIVKEIPKGPSGKLQRIGLAEKLSLTVSQGPEPGFVAPRSATERALARIWAEVLRIDAAGINDDFFQLGGDSILASQISSRVRTSLGADLPLIAFLQDPTIAAMAERLDKRGPGFFPGLIPRAACGAALTASSAQRRMWFAHQLEPEKPLYNRPLLLQLEGPLDAAGLGAALDRLILRHEVLRTSYTDQDGEPVPHVQSSLRCELTRIDLKSFPPAQSEAEAARIVRLEARRPFDLGRSPIRATLIERSETRHDLLVVVHHIAFDGWSAGIVVRDLARLYGSVTSGKDPALPGLTVQYADYAAWQRSFTGSPEWKEALEYWRGQLEGIPELALPTDRPSPASRTFEGGFLSRAIPSQTSRELKAAARRHGATLYMTLLAAFVALLRRYTGQDDIAVGCPVAGRDRVEFEDLAGCFINTLVLRVSVPGDPSVSELIGVVRQVVAQAHLHQGLPLESVVEALQPKRDAARSTLFQVLFQLRNANREAQQGGSVTFVEARLDPPAARLDLAVDVVDGVDGLSVAIEYSRELFDPATVERFTGHFIRMLDCFAGDPRTRLSEIPLLSEPEIRDLVSGRNLTTLDLGADTCVHRLVEDQARRTPDAVALVFEGEAVTYAALNARANAFAQRLVQLGAGPDIPVGILMDRSVNLAVAILAALKAGSAFLPLDPAFPRERLLFMIRDARAAAVVIDASSTGMDDWIPVPVARIDEDAPAPDSSFAANPEVAVGPRNLAYVIYTSGSTGAPKGVMVEHRSICNHLLWRRSYFPLGASDSVLHKTSISFDDAVWEIFEPLISGARLILESPGAHREVARLIETIWRHSVTAVSFVPSLLDEFVRADGLEQCRTLRRLTTGGEVVTAPLVKRCRAVLPAEFYNGYGPTETTIGVTYGRLEPRDDGIVPMGRPIANTSIYILDGRMAPVPAGVIGELYVGGAGLSRGYLGRPQLTAERFMPDPFSGEPGSRMYRTGDLSRWLADGQLEFKGRVDAQVKLRGFRIELEEVEAHLLTHPLVREAAAVLVERTPGGTQLAACFAAVAGSGLDSRSLRDFLQAQVPAFMVPAFFVPVASVPRLPNGKVDRASVRRICVETPYTGASPANPETEVERELAAIWSQVLGVEPVGIDDDFFWLGGHSLLATRLLSRTARQMNVQIPLRVLFDSPTVRQLAAAIERMTV